MQMLQEKTNRNYKDSVFVDLFARDITAKENFISLYNALHGTNLDTTTTDIQPVMLELVLYMKYYNDIAMLIFFADFRRKSKRRIVYMSGR